MADAGDSKHYGLKSHNHRKTGEQKKRERRSLPRESHAGMFADGPSPGRKISRGNA
jgi:hypothetical protein